MTTKAQRWGNSLAVRLPKAVTDEVGLHREDELDIAVKKGVIVLRPRRRPRYRLNNLVASITSRNLHSEVGFGYPAGREAL